MNPAHRALKVGFGLLIDDVGGLEAARAVTGHSTGRLSEAASVNILDRWPRVDHVLMLEKIAGKPRVTEHLARLLGYGLLPIIPLEGDQGEALAAVMRSAGELGARTMTALADGKLSDEERATLCADLDVLGRAVAHARSLLTTHPQAAPALVVNR